MKKRSFQIIDIKPFKGHVVNVPPITTLYLMCNNNKPPAGGREARIGRCLTPIIRLSPSSSGYGDSRYGGPCFPQKHNEFKIDCNPTF